MTYLLVVGSILVIDQLLKSILPTFHVGNLVSVPISFLALGVGVILMMRYPDPGLALILGGGSSNLVDYLALGGVRDNFVVKNAVFNLADVAILVGAALICSTYGKATYKSIQAHLMTILRTRNSQKQSQSGNNPQKK